MALSVWKSRSVVGLSQAILYISESDQVDGEDMTAALTIPDLVLDQGPMLASIGVNMVLGTASTLAGSGGLTPRTCLNLDGAAAAPTGEKDADQALAWLMGGGLLGSPLQAAAINLRSWAWVCTINSVGPDPHNAVHLFNRFMLAWNNTGVTGGHLRRIELWLFPTRLA